MKTYLDCIPCFLNQALRATRVAVDDKNTQRLVLNAVASLIPELPLDATPPEVAQQVYRIVTDITGNADPYFEEKRRANQLALSLYPQLKQVITNADDPLLTACKLAIAGNSIDLAPQSSYDDLNSTIELALTSPLSIDNYQEFRADIISSSRILYLGDNAGEILFDRMLIEELRRIKDIEVYFVVREKPVINDATMDDAVSTGMDKVATVISSGSDAPATIPSQCSPELLEKYHSADITISKGQGNYESLSNERGNIYFFLKVKCLVAARLLGVNVGGTVLLRGRRYGEVRNENNDNLQ